jgi:hypothetical protein
LEVKVKGITWINLLVGIWLVIAAFSFGPAAMARAHVANDLVLGLLLIGFSWWVLAAALPPAGAFWLEVVFGLWLIASPFVLRYASMAPRVRDNDVVCGIIAVIVAAVASRSVVQRPTTIA